MQRSSESSATPPSPEPVPRSSPFNGLQPFEEADADYFFGRDHEIDVLIDALWAYPYTVLYAGSACGKSSVLRAGVYRRLWQQARAEQEAVGSVSFLPVIIVDWSMEAKQSLDLVGSLERAVERSRQRARDEGITLTPDARLLVILDQMDDYFWYTSQKVPEQDPFWIELSKRAGTSSGSLSLLIGIRDDAFHFLDEASALDSRLIRNTFRLDEMTDQQLRSAILEPLRVYTERVTPARCDANFPSDVISCFQPKAKRDWPPRNEPRVPLPILQLVLGRLWERAVQETGDTGVICLRAPGDGPNLVTKAVEEHLLSVLESKPEETPLLAGIIQETVTPEGRGFAASVPEIVSNLRKQLGACGAEIQGLLESLTARRIYQRHPGDGSQDYYEPIHSVVATQAIAWLRSYQEEQDRKAAIEEARNAAQKLHDEELRSQKHKAQLKERELESRLQLERQEAETRRARIVRNLLLAFLVVGMVAAAFVFSWQQRQARRFAHQSGLVRLLDRFDQTALRGTRDAIRSAANPAAFAASRCLDPQRPDLCPDEHLRERSLSTLHRIVAVTGAFRRDGYMGGVTGLDWSADGRSLAIATGGRGLFVVGLDQERKAFATVANRLPEVPDQTHGFSSIRFLSTGNVAATKLYTGEVYILSRQALRTATSVSQNGLYRFELDQTRSRFVAGTSKGSVHTGVIDGDAVHAKQWPTEKIYPFGGAVITAAAVSPKADYYAAAAGTGGIVAIWRSGPNGAIRSGRGFCLSDTAASWTSLLRSGLLRVQYEDTPDLRVQTLAWSPVLGRNELFVGCGNERTAPDKETVGGNGGVIRVHGDGTLEVLWVSKLHDRIVDASWSPSGRYVATVGRDGNVLVSKRENGAPLFWLPLRAAYGYTIRWSGDERRLAIGDSAGRVTVFPVSPDGTAAELMQIAAKENPGPLLSAKQCYEYFGNAGCP